MPSWECDLCIKKATSALVAGYLRPHYHVIVDEIVNFCNGDYALLDSDYDPIKSIIVKVYLALTGYDKAQPTTKAVIDFVLANANIGEIKNEIMGMLNERINAEGMNHVC